jgi:hypothetical protein
MHSPKDRQFNPDAVKITWCACELCAAMSPRFMTLVRNRHEYTVDLDTRCCGANIEDELAHSYDSGTAARRGPGRRIPR